MSSSSITNSVSGTLTFPYATTVTPVITKTSGVVKDQKCLICKELVEIEIGNYWILMRDIKKTIKQSFFVIGSIQPVFLDVPYVETETFIVHSKCLEDKLGGSFLVERL